MALWSPPLVWQVHWSGTTQNGLTFDANRFRRMSCGMYNIRKQFEQGICNCYCLYMCTWWPTLDASYNKCRVRAALQRGDSTRRFWSKNRYALSRPCRWWLSRINRYSVEAVALSGGADSVALLFLIHRLISSSEFNQNIHRSAPPKLLALTVDHDLQPSSAKTAELTRNLASSYSDLQQTLKVDWGSYPMPPRPSHGSAFEEIGRRARYKLLLSAMITEGANVLFMGHHADDQVETAIMRLSRHSGMIGLGGMRKIRRWGMGERGQNIDKMGWAGADGMQKWIVRPLLDIPKARIS